MSNIQVKTFDRDAWRAKKAEKLVLSIISEKYPESYIHNVKEHDIVIPELKKTVEVKDDIGSINTPNYFIEWTDYKGDPSGLQTTDSYWWVQLDHKTVNMIRTDKLRVLCDDLELFDDDTTKSQYYLVKKYAYKTNCEKIWDRIAS